MAQLSVTGGLLTMAVLLVGQGRTPRSEFTGGEDGTFVVVPLALTGNRAERLTDLGRAVDRLQKGGSAPVAVATPGAFLGLGLKDLAIADCGECYIGGMLVRFQGEHVRHHAVSPDTFRTLGIPVIEGREFGDSDDAAGTPVAVVNRAFARASFYDGGPVGRHVRLGTDLAAWYEVVGVVDGEMLGEAIGGDQDPAVYLSALQHAPSAVDLFVPGNDALPAVLAANAVALPAYLRSQVLPLRWLGGILMGLGIWATVVSLLGTLAVMIFVAARRRRELALRSALGAGYRSLVAQTVRETARVLALGVLGGAWVTTALLALVFRVDQTAHEGALTVGMVALTSLFLVGLLAACLVATRVARLEPRAVLDQG
jgi:hypothetical protein